MRTKSLGLLLGASVSLAGLGGCGPSTPAAGQGTPVAASGKGEPVALGDLPPAVTDGVQRAMPGAVLVRARKQGDGTYHLSDVKLGKQEYTLTVAPDGTIVSKEEDDD